MVIVFLERGGDVGRVGVGGGGCDTLTLELVCLPSLFFAKIT